MQPPFEVWMSLMLSVSYSDLASGSFRKLAKNVRMLGLLWSFLALGGGIWPDTRWNPLFMSYLEYDVKILLARVVLTAVVVEWQFRNI